MSEEGDDGTVGCRKVSVQETGRGGVGWSGRGRLGAGALRLWQAESTNSSGGRGQRRGSQARHKYLSHPPMIPEHADGGIKCMKHGSSSSIKESEGLDVPQAEVTARRAD